MAPTLTYAAVALGAALALALWAVFSTAGASARQVRDNLTRGFSAEIATVGSSARPAFGSLHRLTTPKGVARLDRLHGVERQVLQQGRRLLERDPGGGELAGAAEEPTARVAQAGRGRTSTPTRWPSRAATTRPTRSYDRTRRSRPAR